MQVEPTRMYRVKDVAGHFDVSVATIYRAIESGRLAALRLGSWPGTVRVRGSAVLAYAATCGQAAAQPPETDQAEQPQVAEAGVGR